MIAAGGPIFLRGPREWGEARDVARGNRVGRWEESTVVATTDRIPSLREAVRGYAENGHGNTRHHM